MIQPADRYDPFDPIEHLLRAANNSGVPGAYSDTPLTGTVLESYGNRTTLWDTENPDAWISMKFHDEN